MFFTPEKNAVVLYESRRKEWLYFRNPQDVYTVSQLSSVLDTLNEVEHRVQKEQLYAAGFISYEAAPAFDPVLTAQSATGFPLLWFGLYESPEILDFTAPRKDLSSPAWNPDITELEYGNAIKKIKNYIREGDTYQVNFTYRLSTDCEFDPRDFFIRIIQAQGFGFGAYADIDDWVICSASPELFFRLHGDNLESRPMKGTIERGLFKKSDLVNKEWLAASVKDKAENLMILDMVRNDMGRIATIGSVRAHDIFKIEKYPTVWQMTSAVSCKTTADITDIFKALFPAASITGAPKARTMEIIRELEHSPRNLYTGTIGYFAPDRTAQFNVAIRTAIINKRDKYAEYGIGGGIIWDSADYAEFRESRIKARVLSHILPEFSLLETILWTPTDGYFLLDDHLERLASSACYFSRQIDIPWICERLDNLAMEFTYRPHRVRLLVPGEGDPMLEAAAISKNGGNYRVCFARTPVNAEEDVFLYHKTTRRVVYDRALAEAPGCDDVLLFNSKGELTESCIANIVVEKDASLFTPPVECGLLAGVYRNYLLRQGRIREKIITIEDINSADNLYLINSVRRMWRVVLVGNQTAISSI